MPIVVCKPSQIPVLFYKRVDYCDTMWYKAEKDFKFFLRSWH
jgi:hypothetical protein